MYSESVYLKDGGQRYKVFGIDVETGEDHKVGMPIYSTYEIRFRKKDPNFVTKLYHMYFSGDYEQARFAESIIVSQGKRIIKINNSK